MKKATTYKEVAFFVSSAILNSKLVEITELV
jgi:hypothetical protein